MCLPPQGFKDRFSRRKKIKQRQHQFSDVFVSFAVCKFLFHLNSVIKKFLASEEKQRLRFKVCEVSQLVREILLASLIRKLWEYKAINQCFSHSKGYVRRLIAKNDFTWIGKRPKSLFLLMSVLYRVPLVLIGSSQKKTNQAAWFYSCFLSVLLSL